MKKGEIYKCKKLIAKKVGGYIHYFIFWKDNGDDSFLGIMLTTKGSEIFEENKPLLKAHIEEGHTFEYKTESHYIPVLLIKDLPKTDFEFKGKLTENGVDSFENEYQKFKTNTYSDYKAKHPK